MTSSGFPYSCAKLNEIPAQKVVLNISTILPRRGKDINYRVLEV